VIDEHGPRAVGLFSGSGAGMDAAGYRTAEALYAARGTRARFSPLTIDGTAPSWSCTSASATKDQLERADVTMWDFLVPRYSGVPVSLHPLR
jgi:hypothetical protein